MNPKERSTTTVGSRLVHYQVKGGLMRYALIAVMGLLLLSVVGGCAQPNLTRAETESRIDSEYTFDDEYNIE